MAGMLPAYPVFDTDDDISSLPQRWEEWVGGLEDLMSSLAVADHERKWSMLRFYGGDKLRKLETQLQYDKRVPFGEDPAANSPVPSSQRSFDSVLCTVCQRGLRSLPLSLHQSGRRRIS